MVSILVPPLYISFIYRVQVLMIYKNYVSLRSNFINLPRKGKRYILLCALLFHLQVFGFFIILLFRVSLYNLLLENMVIQYTFYPTK